MSLKEITKDLYPLPKGYYTSFLRHDPSVPPLDPNNIELTHLEGDQRLQLLKTPLVGTDSFVFLYKKDEGLVASVEVVDYSLYITQLQGARTRAGYRLNTGMYWVDAIADQIQKIAAHPACALKRIVMPLVPDIKGIRFAKSETSLSRYTRLRNLLGLKESPSENCYIRDL